MSTRRALAEHVADVRAAPRLVALAIAIIAAVPACKADSNARQRGPATHAARVPVAGDLHPAVIEGDVPRTLELIASGADTREADATGATPLIHALLHEHTEIALLLLQHGAEVDGLSRIEPQLLASVVPLERSTRVAVTPLMVAAIMNSRTLVKALLDRGAAIDARGEDDLTALHAAAVAGRLAIARLLLDRGAPLEAVAESGETALDLALSMNQAAVAEVLELAGEGKLSQPIDVAAHYTIAARTDLQPLAGLWPWGVAPIGITVGRDGSVYWTQYRTGTIHRAHGAGAPVETIATGLDGPLGLVMDRSREQLFYVTDRRYPRSIATVRPGQKPRTLIYGTRVNRPFAITVAERNGTLYWTESINGRIRSAGLDGNHLTTFFDDGIASVGERPDAVAVSSAGIAIDEERGLIFWSDLLAAAIVRARLDGSNRQTILSREQGLELPTAVALDVAGGKVYWADPGAEMIGRADLDGSRAESFATAEDGVLEPYGLAVDGERRLLYWTDVARDGIRRSSLDDAQVETFLEFAAASATAGASEHGREDACEATAARARREFLRQWMKSVRTCVINVAAIKAVKRRPSDLRVPADTCTRELHRASDVSSLHSALARDCDTERFGPMIDATLQLGAEIVAADLPRAPESLYDVRPFVAQTDSPAAWAALAALDDLLARLTKLHARPPSDRDWTLPATGQTTTYRSVTRSGADGIAQPVPDDGSVRVGDALAFVDNLDGTITDLNTGLMWEKKCDGCGPLHDYDTAYRWRAEQSEMDVPAWLRQINAEGGVGFAGHDDWRLPQAHELLSIIDYERFNPAVSTMFDGVACGLGCGSPRAPECSCTRLGAYWTAAEYGDDVVVIPFNLGLVSRVSQHSDAFARAVRGARMPTEGERFVDNGDGTVTDRFTRLMWEKKCLCPGSLHNVDLRTYWSFDGAEQTVWDWLSALNREHGRGFAGHDDWRIPNVKELFSLMDYTHEPPSIDRVFAQEDCADVTRPECSCTAKGSHWTSTTFADFPAHALTVGFTTGIVDDRVKTLPLAARAVRRPVP